MAYFSNKEKITKFIENVIIPAIKTKDLDYNKVINAITKETLCSDNIAEELLKKFIGNTIEEIHILTIPKDAVFNQIKEEKTELQKVEELLNAD